jgi:transposase-like protein
LLMSNVSTRRRMNPHEQFCHNRKCRAYGREGEGHIVIHSQKERRYRCKRCYRTFSATKGSALYRMHKPKELVFTVITLLAHGCPLQAIVAAFGLDERTVARWEREAGMHCRRVHEHVVEAGRVELGQVQADELRVRTVGGVMWLAGALVVESRLWLGGVVSVSRDRDLIRALLSRVRACGLVRAVLLCTDGLASYPKAAIHLFREPLRTPGLPGRPRLILPEGVMIAQAIKRYARRRVVGVIRRIVIGAGETVAARLRATQGDSATAVINTAYIERLQATFRSRLAALVRRSRAPVRLRETLEAGMFLVGTCYNFCWTHKSMRREREGSDPPGGKWVHSTPAQAAGLTDHRWSVGELLSFCVPPAEIPKWRGRRPRWLVEAARAA